MRFVQGALAYLAVVDDDDAYRAPVTLQVWDKACNNLLHSWAFPPEESHQLSGGGAPEAGGCGASEV